MPCLSAQNLCNSETPFCMKMARNDPQNLRPFWESSKFHFQGSQMCHKRKFQHSAEFHQEFKRPRFPETITNPSSRMSNSSSSSRRGQPLRRYDEPCHQFRKGWCEYGERCIYSHEEGPVYPFHGGATRPDDRLCRYIVTGQICPYGKNCTFSHQVFRGSSSDDEPRESSAVNVRTVDPNAKKFWKTKICQKWQDYGSCLFGSNCHYAHGHNDLRVLHRSSHQGGSGMFSKVETAKLEPENAAPAKKAVTSSIAAAAAKKVVAANSSELTKNARRLADFNSSMKINGIYGDWIECVPGTLRAIPRSQ